MSGPIYDSGLSGGTGRPWNAWVWLYRGPRRGFHHQQFTTRDAADRWLTTMRAAATPTR